MRTFITSSILGLLLLSGPVFAAASSVNVNVSSSGTGAHVNISAAGNSVVVDSVSTSTQGPGAARVVIVNGPVPEKDRGLVQVILNIFGMHSPASASSSVHAETTVQSGGFGAFIHVLFGWL